VRKKQGRNGDDGLGMNGLDRVAWNTAVV